MERVLKMQINRINNTLSFRENYKNDKNNKKESPSISAAAGALGASLLSVGAISMLTKGKLTLDIFDSGNLKKDLATVLTLSTASITGGLLGGLIEAKNPEDKKAKVKESVFDIMSVAIPSTLATSVLAIAQKKNIKSPLVQVAATLCGVGLGMPLAQKFVNTLDRQINKSNPNAKTNERKLRPQDYLVHIDDIIAIATISKVPFAKFLHADRLLPFIYAWCGCEAGSKTADDKE